MAVLRQLSTKRYDIVHCHWLIPQGVIQALVAATFGSPPYLVTSHGGDIVMAKSGRFFRYLCRVAIGRAARVSVVSKQIQSELISEFKNTGPISVIAMGVDQSLFTQQKRVTTQKPAGESSPNIVFVGRLVEKKGLAYLIKALSEAPLVDDDVRLLILGEGPELQALSRLVEQLHLSRRVSFLGPLPHHEVAMHLRQATIVCVPSVEARDGDRDGTPTVLFEAAASGVPCVATDVGGIPDILRHEENGVLVPQRDSKALAEACHRLLVDPELSASLALEATKLIAEYNWSNIAHRFEELFDEMISQETGW
jgi:glycosyltransferase involved in cell wall biosynthesis